MRFNPIAFSPPLGLNSLFQGYNKLVCPEHAEAHHPVIQLQLIIEIVQHVTYLLGRRTGLYDAPAALNVFITDVGD